MGKSTLWSGHRGSGQDTSEGWIVWGGSGIDRNKANFSAFILEVTFRTREGSQSGMLGSGHILNQAVMSLNYDGVSGRERYK